jgi:hypothetical protein
MPSGSNGSRPPRLRGHILRALVEIGFIVFLFYSNLLMGEFTRSAGRGKTLAGAVCDIFTAANLAIGLVAALIGYLLFEFLRKIFWPPAD